MPDCIAVVNAGSSSIKFAAYGRDPEAGSLFHGQIEGIGTAPHLKVADGTKKIVAERRWPDGGLDHDGATLQILDTLGDLLGDRKIVAVGHRVVHGGTAYSAPVRIDDKVLADLAALVPLAPLHQPHNLQPIRVIHRNQPALRQVACFDTAFHRTMPAIAGEFAIPRRLTEAGVRRYGFHGLSYEFVIAKLAERAPEVAAKRVVIAHLGNGASLCGLVGGKSVATTMGFTALDGLVMGTRPGLLDPGVLLYLMQSEKMDAAAIEDFLYHRSGLVGVSGVSSDMRTLRASAAPEAKEAIDLFVYRIVREIGSVAAAIGGLDALVFTAGIGENDAATRSGVMAGCAFLGIAEDPALNAAGSGRIGRADAGAAAFVIPTDEERMIARHTVATLHLRTT